MIDPKEGKRLLKLGRAFGIDQDMVSRRVQASLAGPDGKGP